jgi:hypothetical protein
MLKLPSVRRTKNERKSREIKKNETVKKALLVVKALAKPVERFKERVEWLF